MKILTICRAGLVRSIALADVLKLHFEPTDVLSLGIDFSSLPTQQMLFNWADKIVIMESHYLEKISEVYKTKILICEVGPDTYGNPKNPELINKVFNWTRENAEKLGVKEHTKSL